MSSTTLPPPQSPQATPLTNGSQASTPPQSTKRTFTIPTPTRTHPTSKTPIHIHEPHLKTSHLGLSTWSSSLVLASQLHKLDLRSCVPRGSAKGNEISSRNIPDPQDAAPRTIHAHAEPCSNADESHVPIRILELGAGTALAGLAACCVLSDSLAESPRPQIRSTLLTLTDLPDVVPNLAKNVSLNAETLAAHRAVAEVGVLDWEAPAELRVANGDEDGVVARMGRHNTSVVLEDGDGEATSAATSAVAAAKSNTASTTPSAARQGQQQRQKYDIILAADTIYSPEHPGALAATIKFWLKRNRRARVCVAYPLRVAYLDEVRGFWEALENGKGAVASGAASDGRGEVGVNVGGQVDKGEEEEMENSKRWALKCLSEGREEVDVGEWDDERVVEWCVWGWADLC